ncbi:MAG: protein translocase subunit SecF [Candidatus Aenigmatarchaeota archaeon]
MFSKKKQKGEEGKDVSYKYLLAIPTAVLVFSIGYLINGYIQTGEWFSKSIELRGGTLITVSTDSPVYSPEIEKRLSEKFGQVFVKETRGFGGYGISVEIDSSINSTLVLAELDSMNIDTRRSSVETIDPALGESFWTQAQIAVIIAFVLMAIVVFVIFRTFVPSIAVIIAASSDIIETIAFMQVFGIQLSLASLAALLMLIGYSVDTDIILTTRVLKVTEKNIDERIKSAMKTGLTTAGTTIGALAILYISSVSAVLSQIAAVLLIGLVLDLVNTWIQNAAIIKWHAVRKGI